MIPKLSKSMCYYLIFHTGTKEPKIPPPPPPLMPLRCLYFYEAFMPQLNCCLSVDINSNAEQRSEKNDYGVSARFSFSYMSLKTDAMLLFIV